MPGGSIPERASLVSTATTGPGAPGRIRTHPPGRNLRLIVKSRRSVERRLETRSTPATRFATQIRTWLLIAALTALLIAIGGAIGGGALYVFVGLAVLMNVGGYWFSDKLALAASRARPIKPGELPELEAAIADLAHRARVPVRCTRSTRCLARGSRRCS